MRSGLSLLDLRILQLLHMLRVILSPTLFHQLPLSPSVSLEMDTERLLEPRHSILRHVTPMISPSGRMERPISRSGQPAMSEHPLLSHTLALPRLLLVILLQMPPKKPESEISTNGEIKRISLLPELPELRFPVPMLPMRTIRVHS